ncbi:hypothetical protein [uncultured Sphingomonas sp.]|uniref:hypothetical protein n=1 Tax=uncultured Sphingomonas sp. TaxID=158754 RepID=UPI0035CB6399
MDGYRGGVTRGGKWGSAAAALVGAPLFGILVLVDALGDCATGRDCHKGFLVYVALPTIAIALFTGLSVRAVMNRPQRNGS